MTTEPATTPLDAVNTAADHFVAHRSRAATALLYEHGIGLPTVRVALRERHGALGITIGNRLQYRTGLVIDPQGRYETGRSARSQGEWTP